MPSATRILRNRIVLFFDFDDTLGPSTTKTLFSELGLDFDTFRKEAKRRQSDMWQFPLAKADLLREHSHREDGPLTRTAMEEVGRKYPLFPGADTFVTRLKQFAAGKDPKVNLEFFMLTAGFKTIPASTVLGGQFDRIYGGELSFDEEGRILAAKRVVSHADKVHYIRQTVEGLDLDNPEELERAFLDHPQDDHYVPFTQVIYVGDGSSDMSAFQLVEEQGGIAIAIDPDDNKDHSDWEGYDNITVARRVHNVIDGDYSEGSELMESMKLAITAMIANIQLLRFGKGK